MTVFSAGPWLGILLFGWPAIILSFVVTATAVALKEWRGVAVGALLAAGPLYYLGGSPRYAWIAPLCGLALLASVYATAKGRRAIAAVLACPTFVLWFAQYFYARYLYAG